MLYIGDGMQSGNGWLGRQVRSKIARAMRQRAAEMTGEEDQDQRRGGEELRVPAGRPAVEFTVQHRRDHGEADRQPHMNIYEPLVVVTVVREQQTRTTGGDGAEHAETERE